MARGPAYIERGGAPFFSCVLSHRRPFHRHGRLSDLSRAPGLEEARPGRGLLAALRRLRSWLGVAGAHAVQPLGQACHMRKVNTGHPASASTFLEWAPETSARKTYFSGEKTKRTMKYTATYLRAEV